MSVSFDEKFFATSLRRTYSCTSASMPLMGRSSST